MLVYKFDLRTCVRIIQTMSIFSATGNNFLENLSGSLIRILCRFARENSQVPRILIEYLVGKHDFYKIMKYDTYTQIQGYNLHGTLGRPSKGIKPQYKIQVLRLPTEIIKTSITRGTTLCMILDNGWELSFRIHSAKSRMEPSLKFDIQLIGIPNTMYNDRV